MQEIIGKTGNEIGRERLLIPSQSAPPPSLNLIRVDAEVVKEVVQHAGL
jgi:hypothetical protein